MAAIILQFPRTAANDNQLDPPPPALRLVCRRQLEQMIAVAIDCLDVLDGDPDLEHNGDEFDFNFAEDDFEDWSVRYIPGPGCPIADPDLDMSEAA